MRARNVSMDNSVGKIYNVNSASDNILISGILLRTQYSFAKYNSSTKSWPIITSKYPINNGFYFPNDSIIKTIKINTIDAPKSRIMEIIPRISTNINYAESIKQPSFKWTASSTNITKDYTYTYPNKEIILAGSYMFFDFIPTTTAGGGTSGTGLSILVTYYSG